MAVNYTAGKVFDTIEVRNVWYREMANRNDNVIEYFLDISVMHQVGSTQGELAGRIVVLHIANRVIKANPATDI